MASTAPSTPGLEAVPEADEGGPATTPWAFEARQVVEALEVDPGRGLTEEEVVQRRSRFGPNALRRHKRRSTWQIFVAQFKSLILALLAVAAVASYAAGEVLEGTAVLLVLLINAAIGFFTELRAVRSMEALYTLGHVGTRVRRVGHVLDVAAEEIVPGDIVVIEGGDVVTADVRLVEASKLQADESTLTGESLPVRKHPARVDREAMTADRVNMLYKGTSVTRGSGLGIVTTTGVQTELGRISALVEEAKDEATPLEKRLDRLGHRLIWGTLVLAVGITFLGVLRGKELLIMIETGVALAVATIPEGLPIVATIVLARGMQLMARRQALINRLSSVETLGATGVICTDKTGTLTENRMTMGRVVLAGGPVEVGSEAFLQGGEAVEVAHIPGLREALEAAVLCNNATYVPEAPEQSSGDPLEVALLAAGARAGLSHPELVQRYPEVREEAFDADVKLMATFHEAGGGYRVAVKGAPEAVLASSDRALGEAGVQPLDQAARKAWKARNEELAAEGLRVLAVAMKEVTSPSVEPYEGLVFIGLLGLLDPPRRDIHQALEDCKRAGIRIVMVTGDQPLTALGVARAVGLLEGDEAEVIHGKDLKDPATLSPEERARLLKASLFARVSPKQKLDLIALHQQAGSIVAMTGDGVNDAPALKKADIGIAMGLRGTQVAREAADMVLRDDAFSSIVAAVEQGRVIFGNLRRFVFYLLSCNVSEVMVVGLAALVGTVLPILPLQILFLNLVTDVFPALALGMGGGGEGLMDHPPRDAREPILDRKHWVGIAGYGIVFTIAVLGALLLARSWLQMPIDQAITISFLTLSLSQLVHVFNMRGTRSGLFRNEVTRNPYIWGALALCVAMVLAVVYVPVLAEVFQVRRPGWKGWGLVLAMSAVPLVVGQVVKLWHQRFRNADF